MFLYKNFYVHQLNINLATSEHKLKKQIALFCPTDHAKKIKNYFS